MPRLTTAPEINTARLILRAHRLDDFERCCAIWSDPDVARFTTRTPATREENWGRLIRLAGHWALLGFGYWVAEERDSGRSIGDVGVFERRGVIEPRFDSAVEAGWALASEAQGRGLATEAMTAVLGWADANLPDRPLVCMIDQSNEPSLRLAERLGFRRFGEADYKETPMILFERERG